MEIKTWHIINTVIVGLFALGGLGSIFSLPNIINILSQDINFIVIFQISSMIFGIISLVWITFMIMSFSKSNIENNYFKISSVITLLAIMLLILSFVLVGGFMGRDDITMGLAGLGIIIMTIPVFYLILIISFIIFMIGYFKNKKVKQNPNNPNP